MEPPQGWEVELGQLSTNRLHQLVRSSRAAQLTAATGFFLLVTPVAGLQPVQLTPTVLAAISILGALGTGAAYVLNYRLMTDEGPRRPRPSPTCRWWPSCSASSSLASQQPRTYSSGPALSLSASP